MRFARAAAVAAAIVNACGGSNDAGNTVVVFAAASLTDVFGELGDAFEQDNPGLDVTFNFASSSQLAAQLDEGAPADVFASADVQSMAIATDAGSVAGEPVTFATNSLAVIVERGNPMKITGIEDLADADLIVVAGDPAAPIGAYTDVLITGAGLGLAADSFEENVRGIVGKVVAGEADAGVVYATDVAAAGDHVDGIAIPDEINVTAAYPIAVAAGASNADGARTFVDFVVGPEGQRILTEHGFGGAA